MNFCLLVFVFVWFCLVLCFCCFAVRFGFCFLLCNSETDHGFSPCHTAKPGTGTVLSKVIFQRPSVWTWSVMACGQKHHWWNDIFLLKHSWQNLEKIDFSYKSPLISGQRNSSAHLSCVFHVQSSSCLHVGLLQHIEQKCKQYLQQVWLLLLRLLCTQLSPMKQKTPSKSVFDTSALLTSSLVLLQVRSCLCPQQSNKFSSRMSL